MLDTVSIYCPSCSNEIDSEFEISGSYRAATMIDPEETPDYMLTDPPVACTVCLYFFTQHDLQLMADEAFQAVCDAQNNYDYSDDDGRDFTEPYEP